MKKTLLFLFGLFFIVMRASADGGWADCAVNLTKDGGASYLYSLENEDWADGPWILNTGFNGYSFGTPSSLVLNGGVGNAWTNDTPGYNPSSFVLYYRVYKTGTMPGSWSQIALDNVNPQNGLNYVFDKTTAGIDVLALATDAGTYILEVAMSKNQFYAGGNWNSMIPGGQGIPYDPSTGGYKATFTKSASIATPTVSGISPSSGTTAGGTSVVITGTNFTGVTAVKFGSVNATNFTVNSNTQITATSPAGAAGTVDVTVTTAGGTSATSASDKFTILVAAPSIAYGVNLVVNGDAETGNLTGWTAGGTDAAYFVNDVTTPYGDSAEAGHNRVFDFYGPARKNQEATLSQTIDITALQSQISSGLVSATSSGQIYGWYSDGSASITITELDANNNALLTHTNGLLHQGQRDNYPNTFWTKDIPMMGTLNSNTRKLKITLYAHTSPTITEDFVDFDNIQLILSTVPTVTTSAVTIFDATSATMGGDVAANGGATVTERGFVYSLASNNTNPQIGGAGVTKVAYSSGGTGSFSQSVGSLAAGTLYYVNAYATNSVGTSYGTVTSFTTMVVANPVISVSGVTAGGLSAAITAAGGDLATVTSLTVTGTIDARDFKTMRDAMPKLATLDLSGATIVAGANIDGTAGITNYPANEIPANAFSDGTMGKTSLTSFSMPSTITSIGGMAFNGCRNLTGSLTIPASVNSIGFMAFGGCSMISSIKAYGATPCSGLNPDIFLGIPTGTCILHVPFGTKALYEAADQWKAFVPNIVDDLVIAPAATTTAASSVTSAGAILNGTVNAYGVSTTVMFEYGLTTGYGTSVTAAQSPVTGGTATTVSKAITGLTPNTTYHYRVVGVNTEGTTHGGDMTFKTLSNPVISVSGVTAGGLSAAITAAGGDLATVTSLTVAGTIDARDFKTMRDAMPKLATLNLSGAMIAAHTGTDGPNQTGNITYPANEIPQYAFYNTGISEVNTSLTSISLPSSVSSIGNNAFLGCSSFVGSLTIPSTLTTIGNNAFFDSGVLFTVDGANPNYSSEDDVLFNKDKTILIQCPISKTGSYTIPSSVTSIGESAFYNCYYITGSLTIPSSVTSIGKGAFTNCIGLTGSVTIPASVTSIGSYAFYGCSNISSIKAYGATPCSGLSLNVFAGTPTGISLHVPPGTKALYEAADQWKAFVPKIVDDLATAPAATTTAAGSVTSSGAILNATVNAYGASTVVKFEYGLTTGYGNTVTADQIIGTTATAVSSALTDLTPNTTYHYRVVGVNTEGTTHGGDMTFKTLSNPVISVSGVTAGGLSAAITAAGGDLATVTSLTVTGTIDARDFKTMRDNMPLLATLNLSGATIAAHTGTDGPNQTGNITYPANEIPEWAFSDPDVAGKTSLTTPIVLPASVTSIGFRAFSACPNLTGITFGSSLTNIGAEAFSDCSKLSGDLIIPNTVTKIGDSAFKGCTGLNGMLSIGTSVTTIGNQAFDGCNGLAGPLTIPSSVTSIGDFAFRFYSDHISFIKAYGPVPGLIALGSNVFDATCTLHVPVGTKALYEAADQWKAFVPKIVDDLVIAPAATTTAASSVTSAGAILNGTVNAYGASTVVTFEYGLTTGYGNTVTAAQSPVTGGTASTVSKAITGLTPNTTYHYRVVGVNTEGTTHGGDMTFKTLSNLVISVSGVTAGGLSAAITAAGGDLATVTSLTVTGTIDARDFKTMRDAMPKLATLDLSGATIAAHTGTDGTVSANITYPANEIPEFAFCFYSWHGKTSLTSISLPASTAGIGINAFEACTGLSFIDMPASLNYIRGAAFYNCQGLTSMTIPASVTAIENNTFSYCIGLRTVTIPASVTSIGSLVFQGCSNITSLNILATNPATIILAGNAFSGIRPSTCKLTVPAASYMDYSAAEQWKDFFSVNTPSPETLSSFSTRVGTASDTKTSSFSVSPTMLDMTITAPAGYEVRESGTGAFGPSLTYTSAIGDIPTKNIEVRIASTTVAGSLAGNLTCSSNGAVPKNIALTGAVFPLTPTVTTQAVTTIGSGTATANGNIIDLGTSTSTAYGVCWNQTGTPSITDNVKDNGAASATGAFTATLTGLTINTTYYVRAYATNTSGTAYGNEVTFTTTDIAPNISYVTPQTYTVGTPIAALSPTNTGGAVPAVTSPQVSTLAGSGTLGTADGLGTAANFNTPVFLAPDAAGNLYVSDLGNNMIRKITPAGGVSTLADASAGFNQPAGIAVDPSGNVYVAENQHHRIRKITPAGVVSTVAGSDSGERGNTNGSGTAARFNAPAGLTLDAAGNLYVSDDGNKQIRKITPAGEVSTFAGSGISGSTDGNGTSASFKSPLGIVIDASGNLYVTDSRNNLIRKISQTGDVTTLAGSGSAGVVNGVGTAASFDHPAGIAVDASGNLYVADSENNLIRKISPSGVVSTLAGSGSAGRDNGAAETASFGQPYGVTVDASGNLYVADTYNNLIRKITQSAYTITPALPAGLSLDGATGTISGTPTAASAATTYTVTAANNGGSSTTTFSIAVKSPQTIAFGTLAAKTYGDATFNLAATSTSGLPVSYSSDNTAVAIVSGSTVTIVGAGTANITASQIGDATYVAAANVIQQLTVNKKALSVTATADTKTYDGTTVSGATPVADATALVTGDVINVAPTQAFDNANAGTTHVLTASGLTIKRVNRDYAPAFDKASIGTMYMRPAIVDVTDDYDISYTTANGTINKLGVTVAATADTKTYNGTTVSTAVPTVGALAAGDAINVAPTQAFDNAAVGTTHVLTASGLTIKNGSTDVTGNYDISYTTANGTINKLGVTVAATADTKTYNGTTVSTAVPTVGALAAGDAINVAPTQAFDNAAVGTTHVLTASGLTIKNGSTDVTGNYDISYTTANGTINKLGVTVAATADAKTYNGTTVSTAVPTVGALAAGDAINVAPTQAFDNAAVGTTHVLIASGLTIKNGSTDVTGNYDISYTTANGIITAKPLTISTPTVTLSKLYDGNTVAAVTAGSLSGVVASDAGKVTVIARASYDNAAVGTNKTITVAYTLGGSAAGNYSSPADVVVTGAEISSGNIVLEPLSNPTPSATNNDLVLSYNVVAGGPTQYKITFEATALAVGIKNVSYTVLATTGADGKITITVPKGTRPGKYKGTLQLKNDSGVESAAYDFVVTVNIPTEYIAVKYNRVLVLDNSTRIFKAYQWYKDGVAIEGATKQFYQDPKGLVGTYSMQATDIDGEVLYSFPKVLNIPLTQKVTAYPSLVRANQTCTVEITDEAMELDLKGAELSVYSSQGIRVYYSTKVEKINTIKLPIMDGMYSGRVTTADGQSFLFKVIVAN